MESKNEIKSGYFKRKRYLPPMTETLPKKPPFWFFFDGGDGGCDRDEGDGVVRSEPADSPLSLKPLINGIGKGRYTSNVYRLQRYCKPLIQHFALFPN